MKKFLIILIIGGILMATYGFCENKCKHEVYTKDEVDVALNTKANATELYTKDEVNTALESKANSADVYTKNEIDEKESSFDKKLLRYKSQGDYIVIEGEVVVSDGAGSVNVNYPTGFNKDNCYPVSLGLKILEAEEVFSYNSELMLNMGYTIRPYDNYIQIVIRDVAGGSLADATYQYKMVLMRMTSVRADSYELGDVNMDGRIDGTDPQLIQGYIMKEVTLSEEELKLADVNQDGTVDTYDYIRLNNILLERYQLGDVNMDGIVDVIDLALINRHMEGTMTLTDTQLKLADVNQDGKLNSEDTLLIAKYINGDIDSFE